MASIAYDVALILLQARTPRGWDFRERQAMMATRLYAPEQFSMTAGVNVPFDLALIEDLYDACRAV
jgi:hypothetical protein